jgi:hypothetical protein
MNETSSRPRFLRAFAHCAIGISLAVLLSSTASAYVGQSFLRVPEIAGIRHAGKYTDWVKFEAQYWTNVGPGKFTSPGKEPSFFSGPQAPREGAGALALSLDKRSSALKALMDRCLSQSKIPEVKYAESADLARPGVEVGKHPADIPAYFEYALTDVTLSCPVVADAPEQAFVVKFNNIKWLNYDGHGEELSPVPAKLNPARASGTTKTFIVTTFASANDVSDDACPRLNAGPTEADYYALMPSEEAAKEKAALAAKGGPMNTPDGPLYRGPDKLNVCKLPGIVRDPGYVSPQIKVPTVSGVDNKLLAVDGCTPGLKRKGLLTMSRLELLRNGAVSMLVQISGINAAHKKGDVDVSVLYSKDPMVRNSTGSQILHNYTFRVSDDPRLTQDFARVRGHLENGVVTTEPLDEITFHDGEQIRLTIHQARMRFVLQSDGTVQGQVSGYQDWRSLMNFYGPARHFEQGMGFQCPGMYSAFKRAADGLPDPLTGDHTGILAAYDIEGVSGFMPPAQERELLAQAGNGHKDH